MIHTVRNLVLIVCVGLIAFQRKLFWRLKDEEPNLIMMLNNDQIMMLLKDGLPDEGSEQAEQNLQ